MDEYDNPPKKFVGTLKPYPHAERPDRGRAEDPVAYLHDVEQRSRERQVAYETVKLLREKVIKCYRTEGVNHYENCREVNIAYYEQICKKDLGQLQPNWSKPEMNDGW